MKLGFASLAAALAAVLAPALAPPATAQLNLSWDDCGAAGLDVKTWTCDSNPDVVARFFVSFKISSATALTQLTGAQCDIRLTTSGAPIPPWWQFQQAGSCRPSGMAVAFNAPCASAVDYFSSRGVIGGSQYDWGPPTQIPSAARLRAVQAVMPVSLAGPVGPGEYYLLTVTLRGSNTVGDGACGGCGAPMGILVNTIQLTQPVGIGDVWLTAEGDRQWIAWQCGYLGEYWSFYNCGTPARAPSWGQIKSLYR